MTATELGLQNITGYNILFQNFHHYTPLLTVQNCIIGCYTWSFDQKYIYIMNIRC